MKTNDSLERFRDLLRIPSISGLGPTNGSYRECATLLQSWMSEIGMVNIRQLEFVPGKPVVIGTLVGSDIRLPSLLLNGHYDVVPAAFVGWSVDPFSAEKRADGKIVCRGTQDMKCVLSQYMEALRELVAEGVSLARTVHVSFLPDEEVGGRDGASLFVNSTEFRDLNVGIALDEGLANPENAFSLFYGERASNWVILTARGATGHGSRFVKNTAIEKFSNILSRIYAHRSKEEAKCHCEHLKLGDVLSMNVTALHAGVASSVLRGGWAINVIPSEAQIAIDIRVPLSIQDIEEIIRREWIRDETDIDIDFVDKNEHPPINTDAMILVDRIAEAIKTVLPDTKIEPQIFPAGTDGRYIRSVGIPCIGFSPIRLTPILLHDNDEFITESGFLEGICVYKAVIQQLSIQ